MVKVKISADYVVVGSGPAGSLCAHNLSRSGHEIVLLEIASLSRSTRESTNAHLPPPLSVKAKTFTPRFSNTLGGNSSLWKSKVYLPSKEEFSRGDWGFTYEELVRASESASQTFGVSPDVLHSRGIPHSIRGTSLRSSIRAKIGNVFDFLRIKELDSVLLFDEARVLRVRSKNGRVAGIQVWRNGNATEIEIKRGLIVAAGGLGSPAFILRHLAPRGLDSLGGLSDHPSWGMNAIVARNLDHVLRRKFQKGVVDYSAFFRTEHTDGLIQTVTPFPIWTPPPTRSLVTKAFARFATKLFSLFARIIVSAVSLGHYRYAGISLFSSQNRNPQNRMTVVTNESREVQEVVVSWEMTDGDLQEANKLLGIVKSRLRRRDGALILCKQLKTSSRHFLAGYNPSCLTPISTDENGSNVDSDLRLNLFSNVWVVSSSVFPVSLVTNPTWTIICLATRLTQGLSAERYRKT